MDHTKEKAKVNAEIDISNVVLKTSRLTLRPWKLSDVDDLYEYAKVDGVGQRAGWLPHKSKEESYLRVVRFMEGKKTFALEYEGKVIGSLGIEIYDEDECPEFEDKRGREIGYVLSKDYWGRGLMPEAVQAVIGYCFNELHLDFLLCGHFAFNTQSWRVQEKCGFRHYKQAIHQTQLGTKEDSWISLLENKR